MFISVLQLENETSWRDFLVPDEHVSATPLVTADSNDAVTNMSKLRHPGPVLTIVHSGVVLQAR